MTNDFQQHINQIVKKPSVRYLDISNRDLNGNADLSEFANLNTFNSSNNSFESLEFLASLPNKNKLKRINFFGNQIKEIDFAWLLTTFPNLESLNIENNPVKTKNLNNLTSSQFSKLVQGIKDKKFRVVSWQGTILMDLLEYAKELVARGNTTYNSQLVQLQKLAVKEPAPEIKEKVANDRSINKTNIYLLAGGLMLLLVAVLAIGYWLGKKKSQSSLIED